MSRYVLPNDPALSAASVTPSDAADLPNYSRMLYVGVGGSGKHVRVTTLNGHDVVFKNVPTGMLMVQAVKNHDLPLLQGVALVFCVVVLAVNTVVDGLYVLLNPRLRSGL